MHFSTLKGLNGGQSMSTVSHNIEGMESYLCVDFTLAVTEPPNVAREMLPCDHEVQEFLTSKFEFFFFLKR